MEARVTVTMTLAEVRDVTDAITEAIEIEQDNYAGATGSERRDSAKRLERLVALKEKL